MANIGPILVNNIGQYCRCVALPTLGQYCPNIVHNIAPTLARQQGSWNLLPAETAEATSVDAFKHRLP